MQSDKNNLLEISKAEANKWIRYGLKKKEQKKIMNKIIDDTIAVGDFIKL